ncbi:MAG: hypothetical protein U0520_02215 [Candidatus Saccharimonadales bacterium]
MQLEPQPLTDEVESFEVEPGADERSARQRHPIGAGDGGLTQADMIRASERNRARVPSELGGAAIGASLAV